MKQNLVRVAAKSCSVLLASSAICGVLAVPAWAQGAASAPATSEEASYDQGIQEILVTARRRAEPLQDVPLAVTALSGDQLLSANIRSVVDLTGNVPSLVVTTSGFGQGTSAPNFSIRGLTAQEPSMLTDPAVTVYFNDVALPRMQGLNLGLYDIAAVEIAKGPQGTLFGRNVTGGAVLIRPNRPEDELAGAAAVEYSSFNTLQLNGMINLPVSEGIALRVASQYVTSDGYIRDVVLDRHVDTRDEFAARVGLSMDLGDRFNTLTYFNYGEANNGGGGAKLTAINPASPFNAAPTRGALGYTDSFETIFARALQLGPYKVESGLVTYDETTFWSVDNTSTLELNDNLSIKNIIAYREVDNKYLNDTDSLPYPILHIQNGIDQNQFSNELQLQGSSDFVDFVIGGYYFRESGLTTNGWVRVAFPDSVVEETDIPSLPGATVTQAEVTNKSYAIFGQATFKFDGVLPGLSTTLGARQNWDKRSMVLMNRSATACRFTIDDDNDPSTPEVMPPVSECQLPVSKSFNELTYNASLEYKFSRDGLVYFAHRHGYRTGGLDFRANSSAAVKAGYNPETVDDFELGLKMDWRLGGGALLRTNFAAYRSNFKDIQRLQLIPGSVPPLNLTVNAAKARINGFEAEVMLRASDMFTVSGFYSYTDAKYSEYISLSGVDLSGQAFALAPKNVYGGMLNLKMPADSLALGSPFVTVKYSHSDGYNDYDQPDAFSLIASSDVVDLTIGIDGLMGTGISVAGYIRNLFDETYYTPYFHNVTLGFGANHPEKPRTFGVRASYKF